MDDEETAVNGETVAFERHLHHPPILNVVGECPQAPSLLFVDALLFVGILSIGPLLLYVD